MQRVRPLLPPPGDARPDWQLLDGLRIGSDGRWGFTSAARIFDEIARLTPIYGGLSHARLDAGFGVTVALSERDHPGTTVLHRDRTARGRATADPRGGRRPRSVPTADFPLQLTTRSPAPPVIGCGLDDAGRRCSSARTARAAVDSPSDAVGARHHRPAPPVRVRPPWRARDTRAALRRRAGGSGRDAVPLRGDAPNVLTNDALDPVSHTRPSPKVRAVEVEAVPRHALRPRGGAMSARVCIDDAGFARLRARRWRARAKHEVVHEAGGTAWAPVDPERPLTGTPSPSGVKHFFLPDGEVLLRWRGDAVTERFRTSRRSLLGVRPRDAVAIDDGPLSQAEPATRRGGRARSIVAISCGGACAHGFCLAVDAGPACDRRLRSVDAVGRDAIVADVATEAGAEAPRRGRHRGAAADADAPRPARGRAAPPARPFAPDAARAVPARLAGKSDAPDRRRGVQRLVRSASRAPAARRCALTCSWLHHRGPDRCEGGGVRRRLPRQLPARRLPARSLGLQPVATARGPCAALLTHKLGAKLHASDGTSRGLHGLRPPVTSPVQARSARTPSLSRLGAQT